MVTKITSVPGPILPPSDSRLHSNNRCFYGRLGRTLAGPASSRKMVLCSTAAAHKQIGVESHFSLASGFPPSNTGIISVDPHRQHHKHVVYQQAGRHQIPISLTRRLEVMELVGSPPNFPNSGACSRPPEYLGGCVEQNQRQLPQVGTGA